MVDGGQPDLRILGSSLIQGTLLEEVSYVEWNKRYLRHKTSSCGENMVRWLIHMDVETISDFGRSGMEGEPR